MCIIEICLFFTERLFLQLTELKFDMNLNPIILTCTKTPPSTKILCIAMNSFLLIFAGVSNLIDVKGAGSKIMSREMDDEMSSEVGAPRRPSSVFNFPINGHHQRPGLGPGPNGHLPHPPALGGLHPLPGHPGLVGYPVFSGRPGPGHPRMGHPPPPAYLVPVPMAVPVSGKKSKSGGGFKFGTFSARGKKSKNNNQGAAIMFLPPPMPPHHLHPAQGGAAAAGGMMPPPPMVAAPAPMALGMPVPLVAPPLSMRRCTSFVFIILDFPAALLICRFV